MEPTTKKWKREKVKNGYAQRIDKQSAESEIRGVSPEEEQDGYGGKDLQKRKVLSRE